VKYTVFFNPEGTSQLPEDIGQLTSVVLDAEMTDSIWKLAKMGEGQAGIEVRYGRLLFPSLPTETGTRRLTGVPHAVVKDDGMISWLGYPQAFDSVTIADIERTRENGLFDGDPHATILDLPDIGNGGIVSTWPDFIQWLVGLGGVYGGLQALSAVPRAIAARLSRRKHDDRASEAAWLADFVKRRYGIWEERGARGPMDFLFVLLGPHTWDAVRLRKLLGIDQEEAAKFLEVCGYVYNPRTKLHQLTSAAKAGHLREQLVQEFMGYDPATLREDLGPDS
jgi:hypothetical protein